MFKANHDILGTVSALDTGLEKGLDYTCPACDWPMVLRSGVQKRQHFAHTPGAECMWADSEHAEHMRVQELLANGLRAQGLHVELEVDIGQQERRVDLHAEGADGRRIAFEVQHSEITYEEVHRRNEFDERAGYFDTVWVYTYGRLELPERVVGSFEDRLSLGIQTIWYKRETPVLAVQRGTDNLFACTIHNIVRDAKKSYDIYGNEIFTRKAYGTKELKRIKATPVTFEPIYVVDKNGRERLSFKESGR